MRKVSLSPWWRRGPFGPLTFFLVLIILTSLIFIFLIYTHFPSNSHQKGRLTSSSYSRRGLANFNSGRHKLAVIVPFRDRFEELLIFAPHLNQFLENQGIEHHIWIVNQVDAYRFNRAALINAGFIEAINSDPSLTYMAMHDVDLLPLNAQLPYTYPGEGIAKHVAALHPKYNYPSFIGGILILDNQDFIKVDGMSNIYWGWGMEDDEFYVRLKQHGIKVDKVNNGIGSGRKDTFRHIHSKKLRQRDMQKCYDQLERTKKRDKLTGLKNVNYTLLSKVEIMIESVPLTILNIELVCDKGISPWCVCPTALS